MIFETWVSPGKYILLKLMSGDVREELFDDLKICLLNESDEGYLISDRKIDTRHHVI